MRLVPGPPPTKADLAKAQSVQRAVETQLASLRSTASGWQKGLSGLVASVTAFGIFSGAEDVASLSSPWDVRAGLAVAASLAVSIAAAYVLLQAAHGTPKRLRPDQLAGSDIVATRQAFHSLRLGIAATLSAAVLAALALGISWYAPRLTENAKIGTSTDEHCGRLVRWSDDQVTIVADGVRTTLSGDEVQSLSLVDSC